MLRSQSNESSPYELSNGLITTCQTSYRPVLLCNLDFPVGQLIYRFSQRDVEAGAHELHNYVVLGGSPGEMLHSLSAMAMRRYNSPTCLAVNSQR